MKCGIKEVITFRFQRSNQRRTFLKVLGARPRFPDGERTASVLIEADLRRPRMPQTALSKNFYYSAGFPTSWPRKSEIRRYIEFLEGGAGELS
jgi:hypothetical protein